MSFGHFGNYSKASFKGLSVFIFRRGGHVQKARQDHLQHDGPTTEVFDSSMPFRGKLLFSNGASKENNLHSRLNKLQRRKCRCLHSIHAAFSISLPMYCIEIFATSIFAHI